MKKPKSVKSLEELGRVRLSRSFFMREFLNSDIANMYGMTNVPDDPELAITVGKKLCEELLEPLQEQFGRVAVRSAYRSCEVNALGNKNKLNCASNEANYAAHIWDRRDELGRMGATVCIVLPLYIDKYGSKYSWSPLAWWIHDNLRYSSLYFFPKLLAFNIQWHENVVRRIDSYVMPKGCLTKPGMKNHEGSHESFYEGLKLPIQ